jgi:hypothetical protein
MFCNLCWAEAKQTLIVTACGHQYCLECGTKHFETSRTCPCCPAGLVALQPAVEVKQVQCGISSAEAECLLLGHSLENIMKALGHGLNFCQVQHGIQLQRVEEKRVEESKALQAQLAAASAEHKTLTAVIEVLNDQMNAQRKHKKSLMKEARQLQSRLNQNSRETQQYVLRPTMINSTPGSCVHCAV